MDKAGQIGEGLQQKYNGALEKANQIKMEDIQ